MRESTTGNVSRTLRRARALCAALTAASLLVCHAKPAAAEEVSPDGKGIAGGALLGGEIVMLPMALFGVRSGLAYGIGGGLGAAGGGVGGYFIEQSGVDSRVPVYMLAGGLALVIPTLVLTLNATRYRPTEGAREDNAPTNTPDADPGQAGGSIVIGTEPAPATPPAEPAPADSSSAPAEGGSQPAPTPPPSEGQAPPPQSMLDVHRGTWRVGVPVPEVRQVYSTSEQAKLGVPALTELRMPVVRVTF